MEVDPYRSLTRRTLVFATLLLICFAAFAAMLESGLMLDEHRATWDLLSRVQHATGRFDASHALPLVAVGIGAGFLAGMLGMGGGVMKVAGMLIFFQLDMLLARAVSLTTMFLATASAARVHVRKGTVAWHVIRPMIFPAILALIGGMFLGNVLPRHILARAFAFFALFLGLNSLAQGLLDPNERLLRSASYRGSASAGRFLSACIGAFHGFVCGLLGISGGVLALPMQQTLLRITAQTAVANSVVVSACITGIGSVAAVTMGVARADFHLRDVVLATLCVGGGAAVGAQFGAHLTGRIRTLHLKLMFAVVTFLAGLLILAK